MRYRKIKFLILKKEKCISTELITKNFEKVTYTPKSYIKADLQSDIN